MSIKKIAEMTGVSYSTVSRVLSNPNYKCSSEEIRLKILEAARELNYIPNEAARSLKLGIKDGKSIFSIGIAVIGKESDNVNTFFNEMVVRIESEIHRNLCVLSNIWFKPELSSTGCSDILCRRTAAEMSKDSGKMPDGIIIIGKCTHTAINALKKHFKAVISVNPDPVGTDTDEVTCSEKRTAALALEYLIKLGHRRIGYAGLCSADQAYAGFCETMFSHKIDLIKEYTFDIIPGAEQGYGVIERLMQHKEPPTAIYCSHDITAVGMIQCLNRYKNRYYMPSVISCGDIEESKFTHPMLTTVHIPKEEMAKFAVSLLLDRLGGGHRSYVRMDLDGTLIIRESCSTPDNAIGCEYFI